MSGRRGGASLMSCARGCAVERHPLMRLQSREPPSSASAVAAALPLYERALFPLSVLSCPVSSNHHACGCASLRAPWTAATPLGRPSGTDAASRRTDAAASAAPMVIGTLTSSAWRRPVRACACWAASGRVRHDADATLRACACWSAMRRERFDLLADRLVQPRARAALGRAGARAGYRLRSEAPANPGAS